MLLRRASRLLLVPLAVGLVLAQILQQAGAGDPDPARQGVFFFLFARHEATHFVILIVVGAGLLPLITGMRAGPRLDLAERGLGQGWLAVILGVAVFVIAALGSELVFHRHPLAMDEFAADFQARVFAAGQLQGEIPGRWAPFAEALTPVFIQLSAERDGWNSGYLPVAAAIRALFVLAGAPDLTNPVLAGLTIPLIWLVARRLWLGQPSSAWVPTVLLAASPQFLLTSMTAYAMPAHALFNVGWLYLYLVGTRASMAAVGLVGVLALGLHQPFAHALFAAPFLARLLVTRRWGAVSYFGAIYLAGSALWFAWWWAFHAAVRESAGMAFSLPGAFQLLVQSMNLGLLASWQPIALSLLVIVALLRWKGMSDPVRDLMLGVVLTLGFYIFVGFDQGHGWGYRYAYPVLASLALLAGYGWTALDSEWRRARGLAFVGLSLALTLLVQLPIRAVQIESVTTPFADAASFVRSLPADIVLVQPTDAWYAQDLVRNDPWLRTSPRVMFENKLTGEQVQVLGRTQNVRRVSPAELEQLGLIVRPSRQGERARSGRRRAAGRCGTALERERAERDSSRWSQKPRLESREAAAGRPGPDSRRCAGG